MLKKLLLLLIILLPLSLLACKPREGVVQLERIDDFVNLEDNSYLEVANQIVRFQALIVENLNLGIRSYVVPSLPLVRSETEITSPMRYFNETYPNELNNAYALLAVIQGYYHDTTGFVEDEPIHFTWGSSTIEATIQMNEDELSLTAYTLSEFGWVTGNYIHLSIQDDLLYAQTMQITYDGEDYFGHSDSVYWEDRFYYATYYFAFEGEFSGISQVYHDYTDNSFLFRQIDHSSEENTYFVTKYDPEDEYYCSVANVGGEVTNFVWKQYSGNDLLFQTSQEDEFIVYFNLKYVGGWDKIEKVEGVNRLFFENQQLSLSSTISIRLDNTVGVSIRNNVPLDNIEISFNLMDTSLTPPILYQDYLKQKRAVLLDADTLYLVFRDKYYLSMEKDSEIIFEHLDKTEIERIVNDFNQSSSN